jgi:DNA alkylation damage repair protein AlkB
MESSDSEFRSVERSIRRMALRAKVFKRRKDAPRSQSYEATDPDSIYDCRNILDYRKRDSRMKEVSIKKCQERANEGEHRVIQIDGLPHGFFLIVGALSITAQLALAKQALEEFSTAKHTNLTNLTTLSHCRNESNDFETPACEDEGEKNLWAESIKENCDFKCFNALRWASLGYHYDWTKRMYRENLKSDFPPNLADLCKHLASLVGESMHAEAAIVNFYPIGTYMSGHLDDAEHAMEEPIVSISLGAPAIFLLGGKTKNEIPTPILIRSGDVIIMAKDSRYSYHGVPAIVPHNFEKLLAVQDTWTDESDNFPSKDIEEGKTALSVCCDICKLCLQSDMVEERSLTSADKNSRQPSMTSSQECSSTTQDILIEPLENEACERLHEINCMHDDDDDDDDDCDNEKRVFDTQSDPVLKYLKQGRININVRRVAKANTNWIDKCGSGASNNP